MVIPFYRKCYYKKLDTVKHYLNLHLAKWFLQAISIPYLSSIFFIKKSRKKI